MKTQRYTDFLDIIILHISLKLNIYYPKKMNLSLSSI